MHTWLCLDFPWEMATIMPEKLLECLFDYWRESRLSESVTDLVTSWNYVLDFTQVCRIDRTHFFLTITFKSKVVNGGRQKKTMYFFCVFSGRFPFRYIQFSCSFINKEKGKECSLIEEFSFEVVVYYDENQVHPWEKKKKYKRGEKKAGRRETQQMSQKKTPIDLSI